MNITVVVQGPILNYTGHVLNNYIESPLISKVILSSWSNGPFLEYEHEKLIDAYQLPIKNGGIGNRNLQIQSSHLGLNLVETEFAWKVRSDQIIPIATIEQIYRFIEERNKVGYNNQKLYVMGDYKTFPFHPRDHFFAGYTTNLKYLFDCPYDDYCGPVDYEKCTRAETWLGTNYLASFEPKVKYMLKQKEMYLYDKAEKVSEALELSNKLMPEYFHVLPRIQWSWPKHGLTSYHYHVGQSLGEYWYEDIQSGRL